MQDKELEKFRHALNEHKNTLLNWLSSESNEQDIQLGGAGREEVERMFSELRQVLATLANGEFGKCQECSGEVERTSPAVALESRRSASHLA